jgi:hypothetical protein
MAPMRTIRWIQRRSTDSVALAVLYLTLAQVVIGLAVVRTVHGQSQEIINDRLANRQVNLETRLVSIEQMNLPARLAVLERSAEEISQVKLMIYGVFVTLIGSLFAQIVNIRGQRKMRTTDDSND